MRLGEDFYRRKVRATQEALELQKLAGLITFQYAEIYYLAGFFHYPTERPIALFIPQRGDPVLFIPRLELDYVREGGWVPEVDNYFEFPGSTHPVDWICERLKARGWDTAALGWEDSLSVGTRERLGRALPHASWTSAGNIVSRLRLIKEPEEIALMSQAAHYADWMLEEGVRAVRTGEHDSEIEIQQTMVSGVIKKMERELDPVIAVPGLAGALVCSGPRSAYPHGLPTSRRIAIGENLILSVACFVGGYFAESERTFLLGDPTPQQRQRYETDRLAQETGTEGLVPGARCADVNRRCLDVIRDAGLGEYLRHRQGHGIGLQNHEPPWIEDGDQTLLEPGMAVSCEPGIYCPEQGGYRISDSVVVTATGPRRLTQYPRNMESNVIPI